MWCSSQDDVWLTLVEAQEVLKSLTEENPFVKVFVPRWDASDAHRNNLLSEEKSVDGVFVYPIQQATELKSKDQFPPERLGMTLPDGSRFEYVLRRFESGTNGVPMKRG